MSALRSLAFAGIFYGGTLFYVLMAMLVLAGSSRRLPALVDSWSGFHRWCVRAVLGIDVRVSGEQPRMAALYAIKHESFFEAIDLPTLLDRPAVFAKEELFALPGWGRAARAYGTIPVARREGAKALRAMMRQAHLAAASGRPLVIFPEGTRVPHARQAALQAGFAALYKVLGLPVVPVAVDSGRLYRGFWKRRGTITYRFAAPIEPGLPRPEIEARVLAAIKALNAAHVEPAG